MSHTSNWIRPRFVLKVRGWTSTPRVATRGKGERKTKYNNYVEIRGLFITIIHNNSNFLSCFCLNTEYYQNPSLNSGVEREGPSPIWVSIIRTMQSALYLGVCTHLFSFRIGVSIERKLFLKPRCGPIKSSSMMHIFHLPLKNHSVRYWTIHSNSLTFLPRAVPNLPEYITVR